MERLDVQEKSKQKRVKSDLPFYFLFFAPKVPPTIIGGDGGPTEKKVVLSQPLILECEAGGHPPPSLTWLKDGVPVHHGESLRVLELGARIEISSATLSDSGQYVCVATSIAGEEEVKYDVTVLGMCAHTHTQTPHGLTAVLSIYSNPSLTLINSISAIKVKV